MHASRLLGLLTVGSSYPSSTCKRCGVGIVCIPFSDGLWVHITDDNAWGYDSALCEDGFLHKNGVLQTAKPQKKDKHHG